MKFAWLSDSHLDTQQYGMERRRKDFELALERAVEDIIARKIYVIIHSGDLINSNRPSPGTMQFLQRLSDKLQSISAVMYVVSGNHDRSSPHWIQTLVTDRKQCGIQLLDFRSVSHPDEDKNGFSVWFYGVPAMSVEQFRKHDFAPADVLVTHQMIREFVDYEQADVLALADLPHHYKLIAVGDVHVHQIIEQPGRPGCYVGYPGSTELKSESEDGNKYWVECHLDINKKLTFMSVLIPTREVFRINIVEPELNDEDISGYINQVTSWMRNNPGAREPMVFITYLNTFHQVMPMFKAALNPDKFILRFKPVFGTTLVKNSEGKLVEASDNLTVEDLLRAEISTRPELFGIASQLIKPDVNEGAALDEFIETRLRELEAIPAD